MIIPVNDILNKIKSICNEYNINPILYGSFAKGTNRERSDLDIAINCNNETFNIIEDRIYNEIETLRHIDLLNLNNCKNKYLLEDIKKYGKQIY